MISSGVSVSRRYSSSASLRDRLAVKKTRMDYCKIINARKEPQMEIEVIVAVVKSRYEQTRKEDRQIQSFCYQRKTQSVRAN